MNSSQSGDHPNARLEPVAYSQIEGWDDDDHAAALACFRLSACRMTERPYTTKPLGADAKRLAEIGAIALSLDLPGDHKGDQHNEHEANRNTARLFFEEHFNSYWVIPNNGPGLVTGYFEPEVEASKIRTERFRFPILARPDDLVDLDDDNRPAGLDPYFAFARKTPHGLVEYYDRKQIEEGALDNRNLELFWLENRIDCFFIHIQGSARLIMPDGSVERITYAGKTGHRFTAIGKKLIERGELNAATVSMQTIRAWLTAHPESADALMRENRSYIFFKHSEQDDPVLGPIAAATVPLTPGRSLAIDRLLHTFATPLWIATKKPLPESSQPFRRLMIAQDTGSAIVGPARGDLFIGSGAQAGEIAGRIRHDAEFITLLPKVTR